MTQHTLDPQLVREVMRGLARHARSAGRVYVTGGVSALLFGWRDSTVDIDIRLDPEPRGVFEGIRLLKRELGVNIELASPSDFVPALPGWRSRSLPIDRFGQVEFLHFDFYTQALAKLSRAHDRDLHDVEHMFDAGLVQTARFADLFEQVKPEIVRYPGLDEELLITRVETWCAEHER